jgi:putative hemolysin
MKAALLALTMILFLASCSSQTPENADTEKRIALCQEVMKLYIEEAKTYERDRKKLIASCHMSQRERTVEQWRCTLNAMQQGGKYSVSSDKCGRTASSQ